MYKCGCRTLDGLCLIVGKTAIQIFKVQILQRPHKYSSGLAGNPETCSTDSGMEV